MDYCDVCISCLDSQSDGTHSLQRSIGERFSKSVQMNKQIVCLYFLITLFDESVDKKLILLFSKDALNWSNVTVEICRML